MKFENLKLKDYFPSLADSNASVDAYIQTYDGELDVKDRPAMIIFPGGGYSGTSHRESEPVALAFAARGYQTFVVWYTCAPAQYPQQLIEGAAAVALVRKNAERFELDPKHISVLGFSAGGHLAGMVSSLYGEQVVVDALGEELTRVIHKPTETIGGNVCIKCLSACYCAIRSVKDRSAGGNGEILNAHDLPKL